MKMNAKSKKGLLRVTAYVALVLGSVTLAYRHARVVRAQELGAVRGIGQDMMPLRGLLGPDPHRLHLNGEAIWVAHATTKLSVKETLDRFQSNCTAAGAAPWTWQEAEKRPVADLRRELAEMQLGSKREETEDGGTVLCFVPTGDAKFLDRVLRFQQTVDLSAFGKLRVVQATRANGYVNVISSWTDGAFRYDRVFGEPRAGEDAPGEDGTLVPRPSGSQRTMSSTMEGTPYATRAYEKDGTSADVLRAYAEQLRSSGWDFSVVPVKEVNEGLRAFKRGTDVVVVSVEQKSANRARVLVSELGSDPTTWSPGLLKPAD